jgi:hypothetical protein
MQKVAYICLRCQREFELNVLEPGEAEARKVRGVPPKCSSCNCHDVEELAEWKRKIFS